MEYNRHKICGNLLASGIKLHIKDFPDHKIYETVSERFNFQSIIVTNLTIDLCLELNKFE